MPDAAAPPPHRAAVTRGFLFADLRGYTAFVELRGAHQAAAMLDRYRALVRAAVATFDGAEIRTEGDSFYVVFDSASAAIECGLAIVAAAGEATLADASMPIRVGVGIHAGETVETGEGFVGSAVNTAARICAQAGPNEVLVSATVRTLTAGVVDARFEPIGRRRLKGLNEPIQLFRAVASHAPVTARTGRPSRRVTVGVALVVLLVVAIVAQRPWLDAESAGLGSAPSSAATASGAATVGVSAPPSPAMTDAFPTAEELSLLELIDEADRHQCDRASPDDVPELTHVVRAGNPPREYSDRQPIQVRAGIVCALGGFAAPDMVWYWDLVAAAEAAEWIAQQGGSLGATNEPCSSSTPSVERWSFGGGAGRLLCYETATGDAVLAWSYDDGSVMGRALRDDRDMDAALRWWMEEARFLSD